MTAASDYHAARPAFQSMNEPSAEYVGLATMHYADQVYVQIVQFGGGGSVR